MNIAAPKPLSLSLTGRLAIVANLRDAADSPVAIEDTMTVEAYFLADPGTPLDDAFLAVSTDLGILVTDTIGQLFIDLADDAQFFALNSLAWMLVLVKEGATVTHSTMFMLVPVTYPSQDYPTGGTVPTLSTRFVNTLALVGYVGGGATHLDGLVTLTQPVGCFIEFQRAGVAPEQWVLEVWTSAAQNTVAGEYQLPLDFNAATNAKVWRKTQ